MGFVRSTKRTSLEKALATQGFTIERIQSVCEPETFSEDGLTTNHVHESVRDPETLRAYERGVEAVGEDYHIRWRAHMALWAASVGANLTATSSSAGSTAAF